MSETKVVKVADGEELVFEGVAPRRRVEDARERTNEVRTRPANPPRTEGLTPLDRDRASSIADEGGASAAEVEKQRPPRPTITPVPGEDAIDPDETPTQPWAPIRRK